MHTVSHSDDPSGMSQDFANSRRDSSGKCTWKHQNISNCTTGYPQPTVRKLHFQQQRDEWQIKIETQNQIRKPPWRRIRMVLVWYNTISGMLVSSAGIRWLHLHWDRSESLNLFPAYDPMINLASNICRISCLLY